MTMFHDTFCTPSTFDKLIHDGVYTNNKSIDTSTTDNNDGSNNNTITSTNNDVTSNNNNKNGNFDIYTQPQSSNSSLTSSAASVSSTDESVVLDQKLLLWIQRQLEFYITLSILPALSSIDDLGHGKLLLCLIHRFAPGSLPSLVTILEEKTSIECLLLADDLAQQLWNTAIDSLAVYLYHHHQGNNSGDNDDSTNDKIGIEDDNTATIGDYVDQLIVPSVLFPPTNTQPSSPDHGLADDSTLGHNSSPDNIDEENHAQLPAAISADTLPNWQPLVNNTSSNGVGGDTTSSASSLPCLTTRHWIATTHQSVHHFLHQPHTIQLSALVSLLQQLQQVYVGFTRLTSMDAATLIGGDELVQSTQLLLRQLKMMDESITRLTTTPLSNKGDHSYLIDVLVQRHVCLRSWVQTALGLFQQSSRVQNWVSEQHMSLEQIKIRADGQVDGFSAWLDSVSLYRQENTDVVALTEYYHRHSSPLGSSHSSTSSKDWVAHVTLGTVIKTLDELDGLVSTSDQVSRQIKWVRSLNEWQTIYTCSLNRLGGILDSVLGLARQATRWTDADLSCTTMWQQWKILSKRVADFGNDTQQGGYAMVLCMHRRLQLVSSSSSTMMESVDGEYKVFAQKWHQLERALERTRIAITRKHCVEDFVQQCQMVQIDVTQLVKQLESDNSAQRSWMEQCVQDMDRRIAQLLVLGSSVVTGSVGDDATLLGEDEIRVLSTLVQDWRDILNGCKVSYHQALDGFRLACIGLKQQQALEAIKQQLSMQVDVMMSSLFDPWTCCVGDRHGLDQDYSSCRRHFGDIVLLFDQWIKDGGNVAATLAQEVQLLLDKGKKWLADYDHRLGVLQKRSDWEQQWCITSTWVKAISGNLHKIGGGSENSARGWSENDDSDLDDMRQQILGHKQNIDQLQQLFGLLVDNSNDDIGSGTSSSMSISRIRQRQHLLDEEVVELYKLLDATCSAISQSKLVNEYMSWVDDINQSSQSIGARLDEGLRSEKVIKVDDDSNNSIELVDQDIQALESSAVQLWQESGSQIIYPLSLLVVDDKVRWQVLNAYGDLLASLVQMASGLDAWGKRSLWEKQWRHDMEVLQQGQHSINSWLQHHLTNASSDADKDDINATITTIRDYEIDPLQQLQQLFTITQQHYPSNIKMPAVLEEQQQQLAIGTFGHLKILSNVVNYLQTAKKLEDKCNHMDVVLNEQGDMATEEDIQQWIDDIKVSVDQQLFGSLREQYVQLLAGTATHGDDQQELGQDKIQMVFDKAECTVTALHLRLSSALKASHHNRLVRAHKDSVAALTLSLQQVRDELALATSEHGRMVSGSTPSVYQDHEQALGLKQQAIKHLLDTVHSVSYNDVKCLCQLIQLQQEEVDVASRQAQLDDLWQAARKDTQDVQRLVLDLGQWRDLLASLDRVEAILGPVHDYMDTTTMVIKTDLASTCDVLLKIYQDAHTMLATVHGMVPGNTDDDHNRNVFVTRSGELSMVADGILTGLLKCAIQEANQQSSIISKRLDDITGMKLFNDDGGLVLLQQWDGLMAQMAETGSIGLLLTSTITSLKALCGGKNDDSLNTLVNLCQQSVDKLSSAMDIEQHCSRTLLATGLACGRQATSLLSWLDEASKELDQFVLEASSGSLDDWRLDLRVWEYRMANYEKKELAGFFDKVQDWLSSVDQSMKEDLTVKAVGQHVEQAIHSLVQVIESRWQNIQAQLAEAASTVTHTQMGKEAEQQWQELSALVDTSCERADALVAGFYDGGKDTTDDDSMVQTMGQEQDLVVAEQSLTIMEHEMRPLIKSKAMELKNTLDGLAAAVSIGDVDNVIIKWENKVQQHKQHLRHGITKCQYFAAAAEVHGYMYAMEQVIDKNNPELMVATRFVMVDGHAVAVELETKHKIYSGALDISMEKARQSALLMESSADYTQLVVKRSKLEQRFNDRMKEWLQWIGSTSSSGSSSSSSSSTSTSPRLSGLRSRKISLPSKMPSPPMTASTATSTTVSSRRRVASSISSSSSPLLQAQRKSAGRKSSFTNAIRPPPAPNSYVADPKNDLDMEIGRIVNKAPYKVELQMVPGEAGRYRFGDKVVYCRILKSHMVMVRVGGGWTELSQFLRDHALLVNQGSGFVMRKSSMESCQEAFLETKRATSPTSGRPLPRMSQSSSTSTVTSNAGYKDGDRYIAVDMQGQQHEMKMTPHDSNSSRRRS
ncbi:hypothetical protein BC941DRAFT_433436 [Chlamydoabsidia padenii]|nr:hypothetical protein BC941DRAFT_433436 [Chlamydoabsidia padenii]